MEDDLKYALTQPLVEPIGNWYCRRTYRHPPPTTAGGRYRRPGWTETWGKTHDTNSDDGTFPSLSHTVPPPVTSSACSLDRVSNEIIRLVQYRPAWLEQFALRVAGIEHHVVNASFAVTEATGPLPYLMMLPTAQSSPRSVPALVGRFQLSVSDNQDEVSVAMTSGNAILDFLSCNLMAIEADTEEDDHDDDLAAVGITDDIFHRIKTANGLLGPYVSVRSTMSPEPIIRVAYLYTNIIRDILQPSIIALRYHVDPTLWDQLYRPQSLRAANGHYPMPSPTDCPVTKHDVDGQGEIPTDMHDNAARLLSKYPDNYLSLSLWKRCYGTLQTWCERSFACGRLLSSHHRSCSLSRWRLQVRESYQIFEAALMAVDDAATELGSDHEEAKGNLRYVLGTSAPTTVDFLLFDHFMEALQDVHLVKVLVDFPRLCLYGQQIWETFFMTTDSSNWQYNNNHVNAHNAFVQWPPQIILQNFMENQTDDATDAASNRTVDQLMKQLLHPTRSKTVQKVTWHDFLTQSESMESANNGVNESNLDRRAKTCPQESRTIRKSADFSSSRNKERDALHRQMKHDDETWLTIVGLVGIVTVLGLTAQSSMQQST
jgi:hypothetical protein